MRKTKLLVSSSCILLDFLCLSSCDKKNASLVNRRTATPEKIEEIKEAQRAKERAETEAQRKAQEEERSAAHHVVVDTTTVPTPAPEEPEPGPEVGPAESQQNQNQNEYRSLLPSVPLPPQPVSPHDGGNMPPPGQLDPDPEVAERLARALEGLPDPPPPVNADISNNGQYRQCSNSGSSSSSSSSSTLNIAKSNIAGIAEAQSRCRVRKCSGFDINWRRRISIFETVNQTHAKLPFSMFNFTENN
ncbi:hypothetical protein AGMMS49990_03500 [Endomicrobiia bacterium]|nr:hypothetical protein AGMMS49990_03500 [Endomicrobiia bacterium]